MLSPIITGRRISALADKITVAARVSMSKSLFMLLCMSGLHLHAADVEGNHRSLGRIPYFRRVEIETVWSIGVGTEVSSPIDPGIAEIL